MQLLFPAVLPYIHTMNITSLFCLWKLIQKSRQITDKEVRSWEGKVNRNQYTHLLLLVGDFGDLGELFLRVYVPRWQSVASLSTIASSSAYT
jgi:hypothetical protein